MPTYDYECRSCGHRFEKFQSMTAKVLRKCPACGERTLERLIGPGGGIIFKGDGFYTTDYRSKSYKAGKKADSGEPKTDSDKSGSGKKDTPDAQGSSKSKSDKG